MENRQIDWSKWDSTEDNFAKYAHVKSNLIYGTLPAEKPDVSIMTPTFRRADLLRESLDSALNQKTQYSYTITVVDNDAEGDAATDALMKEYCEKYSNILYYRNEQNIGMYGNWNRCIELAQADWLCMLHDDDMLKENTVEKLFSVVRTEKYGIVCCATTVVDERKSENKKLSKTGFGPFVSLLENMFIKARRGKAIPMNSQDILKGIAIGSATHMVNVKKALSSGGYDDRYYPPADIVFYQKMIKYYGGGYVPEQLYYYRIVDNVSIDLSSAYKMTNTCCEFMSYVFKQSGGTEIQCRRKYNEYMIYFYHTRLDYKEKMSMEELNKRYHVPLIYGNPLIRCAIVSKYILRWGLLLFRPSK